MGNTNGVLTEVSRKRVNNRTVVLVSCSCGEVREKRSDALAACKWTCTHCPFTESLRNLRAYSSWDSMKQRYTNPNNCKILSGVVANNKIITNYFVIISISSR